MIQAYKAYYKKGEPGDPARRQVQARGSQQAIETVNRRAKKSAGDRGSQQAIETVNR
ncbi:MAG: hypothetical protein QNJ54_37585 [Prochloraceae cyanobacterium]|nr:hypothetical protein [Prochloraceae cyanobacterium]